MCKFKVIDGTKETEYIYEFAAARKLDENTFLIVKNFTNGFEAEEYARGYDCVVIHNVRIQGRKKIEKKS